MTSTEDVKVVPEVETKVHQDPPSLEQTSSTVPNNKEPSKDVKDNDSNGTKNNSQTTTTNNDNGSNNNHPPKSRHEDENPLVLQSKYILSDYHPIMTPLIDPRSNNNNNINKKSTKTEDNTNNNKQKENRHKKNKRELKKRSRENDDTIKKICKTFLMGKVCPYGNDCKYTHDLKEILNTREEDIKEIGKCPHFELKGECPFGIACRIGSEHLNLATGQNICKSVEEMEALRKKNNTKVMNIIPRDVVDKLRKKKYKFVCKRHNEKRKNNNRNEEKMMKAMVKKEEDGVVKKGTPTDGTTSKDEESQNNGNVTKEVDAKMEEPGNGANAPTDQSNGDSVVKKEDDVKMEEAKTETKTEPTSTTDTSSSNDNTKPKAPFDMSPLPRKRKIIDFSNKVYVAPLTTVGNLPFRRIMKKFGADITCGEMAVAHNLLQGKNSEWALIKRHPDEDVFGVQIAAAHADVYTRLSEVIENEQLDVDFLDMNLGCPIDVLCNQGCGAKLMLRENKLRDSLKGMLNVLNIPVTVKIRTGWDEKKPFAHKLVPKIQEWNNACGGGVAAVMVHGRSRLQRYSKLANWDYIQEVAAAQSNDIPKLPILGNGDIFSYNDYEEKVLKHEGISPTAMIGRGALIKPWLPIEIKERRHWDISASERLDFLKDFVKFGLEHWGSDQQGVNTTRRFLLEWLSFLYRYVPVGILEVLPQSMNQRPPAYMCGRNDLETLMLSKNSKDWVKISEMLLGKVPDGFEFEPKHKANSYK